jgi:hypothetical protein
MAKMLLKLAVHLTHQEKTLLQPYFCPIVFVEEFSTECFMKIIYTWTLLCSDLMTAMTVIGN